MSAGKDVSEHKIARLIVRILDGALDYALLLAILLVAPIIAYNGGIFYYYGDFNVQEIPFYQLIHSQVRSGDLVLNVIRVTYTVTASPMAEDAEEPAAEETAAETPAAEETAAPDPSMEAGG